MLEITCIWIFRLKEGTNDAKRMILDQKITLFPWMKRKDIKWHCISSAVDLPKKKKFVAILCFINNQMNESWFHSTLSNFKVILIRHNEIRHHFPQHIRDCFWSLSYKSHFKRVISKDLIPLRMMVNGGTYVIVSGLKKTLLRKSKINVLGMSQFIFKRMGW